MLFIPSIGGKCLKAARDEGWDIIQIMRGPGPVPHLLPTRGLDAATALPD
jgi:hypothetical protein